MGKLRNQIRPLPSLPAYASRKALNPWPLVPLWVCPYNTEPFIAYTLLPLSTRPRMTQEILFPKDWDLDLRCASLTFLLSRVLFQVSRRASFLVIYSSCPMWPLIEHMTSAHSGPGNPHKNSNSNNNDILHWSPTRCQPPLAIYNALLCPQRGIIFPIL